MFRKSVKLFTLVLVFVFPALPAAAQKSCFTAEAREQAERTAKVFAAPDPDYDPVLGYNPKTGARTGAPRVDADGLAAPITCVANKKVNEGSGTTPKFYCSVPGVVEEDGELIRYKIKPHFKGQARDKRNGEIYGEFLSSRFSKALGFFADDDWVADVTCPDCEKSLNKGFQGASFNPFQPAAGIELPLGDGIDVDCSSKDSGAVGCIAREVTARMARRALRSMLSNSGSLSSITATPRPTTRNSVVSIRRKIPTVRASASRARQFST